VVRKELLNNFDPARRNLIRSFNLQAERLSQVLPESIKKYVFDLGQKAREKQITLQNTYCAGWRKRRCPKKKVGRIRIKILRFCVNSFLLSRKSRKVKGAAETPNFFHSPKS
jgi:hypothetical protein